MDNPLTRPSIQGLKKPQIFVKVEFGVSWSAQHAPRKHGIEYKSRGLRERATNFPRHIPAPTTNYLAAASIQQFHPPGVPSLLPQYHYPQLPPQSYPITTTTTTTAASPPQRSTPHRESNAEQHAAQQNLLPPPEEEALFSRGRGDRQVNFAPEPEIRYPPAVPRRRSRATVRSSSLDRHDRGHSAPPPLSENSWDVSIQPQQPQPTTASASAAASSTACAITASRPRSDVWKDLPELPSKFRLGEDELPWEGTWAFPMGWEPFLELDPFLQQPGSSSYASAPSLSPPTNLRPESRSNQQELPSTPTVVKIESPIESPRLRQTEPSKRSDLEALGSAMMTVDNGFENQWWNQGSREVIPSASTMALHPPRSTTTNGQEEQMALGWVGALLPPSGSDHQQQQQQQQFGGSTTTMAAATTEQRRCDGSNSSSNEPSFSSMVVSPVSSYNGPVQGLSRALSTRSDELWFSSPRYA